MGTENTTKLNTELRKLHTRRVRAWKSLMEAQEVTRKAAWGTADKWRATFPAEKAANDAFWKAENAFKSASKARGDAA